MKRTKIITWAVVAGLVILLTAMATTVLNKRWWIKRVNQRWQYMRYRTEDGQWTYAGAFQGRDPETGEEMSLWDIIHIYRDGRPTWWRTRAEYEEGQAFGLEIRAGLQDDPA